MFEFIDEVFSQLHRRIQSWVSFMVAFGFAMLIYIGYTDGQWQVTTVLLGICLLTVALSINDARKKIEEMDDHDDQDLSRRGIYRR